MEEDRKKEKDEKEKTFVQPRAEIPEKKIHPENRRKK